MREFIWFIAKIFLVPVCGIIYGDLWHIKEHLRDKGGRPGFLRRIYDERMYRKGAFIGCMSEIPHKPCFPHGMSGIFISNAARLGKNCVIFQQVTIGSDTLADSGNQGSPVIGNNVYIGAGAKIIGAVHVGDNCRIGANAVVYKDMPDDTLAVCASTRFISKPGMDNRYMTKNNRGQLLFYDDGNWKPVKVYEETDGSKEAERR